MKPSAPSSASEFSPIAIFAYKRPSHLDRLFDSLTDNELYSRSPVFVFCDGPRGPQDHEAVEQTRRIAQRRIGPLGQIVESPNNKGLAQSIIEGVSSLCRRYGRVIVLEDDLVLHPRCLNFLNAALRYYVEAEQILHVNAYRYPMPPASGPTYSRLVSSWGWATWQRAWTNFESDAAELERRIGEANLVSAMDFGGAFPYYAMLQAQARGDIDSWAIRWYASTLLRAGLTVYPNVSQVRNQGFDDTGVHCGVSSAYDVDLGEAGEQWPMPIVEDLFNYRQMQTFFRSIREPLPRRVLRNLKRLLVAK